MQRLDVVESGVKSDCSLQDLLLLELHCSVRDVEGSVVAS